MNEFHEDMQMHDKKIAEFWKNQNIPKITPQILAVINNPESVKILNDTARQKETLILELWTLWESLAEAGEITINKKFIDSFSRLEGEVNKIKQT